ncbi:MAG: Corrinoid/iron-sulfur protein large subunit [Anaerolineales bacterium]|nr:Corrinoid/iron-sulfur protein large subunit [Anaerolineales bacterium]
MALSGLEIYKLLPRTNCGDCDFPTCLAFAMKLAAKQAELADCPYVTDEAKVELEAASQPPVRLITLSSNGHKVEAGNETVLFRHEKRFFHKCGLFVRVKDTDDLEAVKNVASEVDGFTVDYVGLDLELDGMAVEAASGDPDTFAECVEAVRSATEKPLILIGSDPDVLKAGVASLTAKASGTVPLLYGATPENWESMAALAKKADVPLGVRPGGGLEELAELTEQVKGAGVQNIVLDPAARDFAGTLTRMTQMRRLALKKNFRPLGYPIITFPGEGAEGPEEEVVLASQHIAKYGGFIVLDHFSQASAYPLLVFRENVFTDPQEPIQVEPGLYEINDPTPDSPVMITTNFSITYFSVANEVESAGVPGWLIVADAEGMSVLTAWAAGEFDADRIAKSVNATGVADKIDHQKLVIPGHVAVLSGELEEELPGWDILVGPREAVDLPAFLKLGNE